MNWNNKDTFATNNTFEWTIFGLSIAVLVASLIMIGNNSVNSTLSALVYILCGVGMSSKAIRAKGFISQKHHWLWIACIAAVFLAAALTLITKNKIWNSLWLISILAFSFSNRKKVTG